MTFNKLLLWGIFTLPWFSLFLLKKQTIKHYMPVAVFTTLVVTLFNEMAFTQKWFAVKETIFPWVITFAPFVFGAFAVCTIWIFYLTYQRFWLYLLTNIIADAAFVFLAHNLFRMLGLIENLKFNNYHLLITFVLISIIIYGYQVWQEEVIK